jgi:hypothetical protein
VRISRFVIEFDERCTRRIDADLLAFIEDVSKNNYRL